VVYHNIIIWYISIKHWKAWNKKSYLRCNGLITAWIISIAFKKAALKAHYAQECLAALKAHYVPEIIIFISQMWLSNLYWGQNTTLFKFLLFFMTNNSTFVTTFFRWKASNMQSNNYLNVIKLMYALSKEGKNYSYLTCLRHNVPWSV
jgi:hypothetical protein